MIEVSFLVWLNIIRLVLMKFTVNISRFTRLVNLFFFIATHALMLFVLALLFTMLSFFFALGHLFFVLLASLTVFLGLLLGDLFCVGKLVVLVFAVDRLFLLVKQFILTSVVSHVSLVNRVRSSRVRIVFVVRLARLGITVVVIAFHPFRVTVTNGMRHIVVSAVVFSHVVIKTTSFWLVE